MKSLSSYFINAFDSADISLDRLISFSTDHLGRMNTNNPDNLLGDRIAATTTALAGLLDSSQNDLAQLGIRKAVKDTKDLFREQMPESLRRIHGGFSAVFGDPSPQLTQAFPSGRTAVTDARDDKLQEHLDTVAQTAEKFQANLPQATVILAQNLAADWKPIYDASEEGTADKQLTEQQRREARSALARELYITLAELMQLFPAQVAMLERYMQQSLLDPAPRQSYDPPHS